MTSQYLRKCSISLLSAAGNVMNLEQMHVKFHVSKADVGTPQVANIRIYNLNPTTAQTIQDEYSAINLQAGYAGNMATIFQGTIRQKRTGRENGTDTYLDIMACDGDVAHNFSVSNESIPSGWAQGDLLTRLKKPYAAMGVDSGYTPEFKGPKMPRGKVLYGMTRDYLHTLADASGCSWHVVDGKINFLPISQPLPGPAVVVNAATGMIGTPRQTLNGVELRVLINPQIKFGGQLKILNSSIQQIALDPSFGAGASNNFVDPSTGKNTGLDAEGFYKVYAINMIGDTRGNDWYFDIICAALNATGPITGPWQTAVASSLGF